MHSHHQGSDPAWSTNRGYLAPSLRSAVSAVPPEQVVYQRRQATEAYSDWDEGEEDQAEFNMGDGAPLHERVWGSHGDACVTQ